MGRRVDGISRLMSQAEEEAEIDLTPMLDVVFIMLIFFIVTASFLREFGVDATKPPSVQQTKTESKTIAIKIYSDGDIVIDGLSVDPRDSTVIADLLRRLVAEPGTIGALRRDEAAIAAFNRERQVLELDRVLRTTAIAG